MAVTYVNIDETMLLKRTKAAIKYEISTQIKKPQGP